ncbi:MAG: ABC transporter ATP-binding protein/permease [Erysipelotrichaceae bacterium]|nr:ABC transporter ATP-binding protein/permease [Erysipelotrichaceae bacterium]
MLKIENITKTYKTGDLVQNALNGVSLNLRDNEFVAILGPSGSGKTTLLNIIGGLDRYDTGDLIINNVSTKNYKDRDWDSYRNHTIGFIFQSYNLIPHQTVLSNVELALTISGISKKERTKRALDALEEVGLKEQAHKKPNQMSGGQMQRVAIARALVNNPDILLADEPTGALDTKTSIQVMELLKKVAKDRLVVMVTHNPELAEQYANRIVRLQDGNIISDSNPFNDPENEIVEVEERNLGKARMGFFTALSLSFNNLMTKKGRTILTGFAGSIGIIGIALILALSTGFQNYIDQIQEDTMTSYPLTIQSETANVFGAMLSARVEDDGTVSDKDVKEQMMISSMFNSIGSNDLKSFKVWLEDNEDQFTDEVKKISYSYSVSPRIYTRDVTGSIVQLNPNTLMSSLYSDSAASLFTSVSTSSSMGTFSEYETEKVKEETTLLSGRYPENDHEVILVLSQEDKISDLLVYSLGLRDNSELKKQINDVMTGNETTIHNTPMNFTYEELMDVELKLVDVSTLYRYNSDYQTYEDMSTDEAYMEDIYTNAEDLIITGVAVANSDSSMGGVIYSPELIDYVISKARTSALVQKQLNNKDVDVFSNTRFDEEKSSSGIDFNDMVSIDQDALSNAFQINIDMDSISMDSIDQTQMTNIIMNQAQSTAQQVTSGPNVTQLSALFTGANSAIVSANVTQFDMTHLNDTYDTLIFTADDVTAASNAITKDTYKQSLNAIISTMSPDSAGMLQMLSDTDYTNLADAVKIMFEDYYTQILNDTDYDQNTNSIAYSMDQTTNTSTYGTSLTSQSLNASLLSNQDALAKTTTTVNSVVNNYTTYIIAAGIGQATSQVTAPMMETMTALSDAFSGDIITVDTDAFATAFNFDMDQDELQRLISSTMSDSSASYSNNLINLGYQDKNEPTSISIYFKDFAGKTSFLERIDDYNSSVDEETKISYTDITGLLMSSVETIINSVTYVLIAFVSISLVVSSIMIAVITLISVMERTKEIGILRAMGASKSNVSSIFNAETFIIGLLSGSMGIGVTYALIPLINNIIHNLTGNNDINATLNITPALILVGISVMLTMLSGLIPSRKAAKQDPVIALRSE